LWYNILNKESKVQTFCPVDSFSESASVLDNSRLGKQIIESQQIFKSLSIPSYGWKSHPATKMWRGHRGALLKYTEQFNNEWRMRRGKDHGGWLNLLKISEGFTLGPEEFSLPRWWGRADVHDSHKSNLIRKLPEHYRAFWPDLRDDMPYVWPE
jgi:hypothetical protein